VVSLSNHKPKGGEITGDEKAGWPVSGGTHIRGHRREVDDEKPPHPNDSFGGEHTKISRLRGPRREKKGGYN